MKLRKILITAVILFFGALTFVSAQKTNQENLTIKKTHQTFIGENVNNVVKMQYVDVFKVNRRKMEVRIYNECGKQLYSKNFWKKGHLNIAMNISQAPYGNYTFEILNKGELVCSKVVSKQTRTHTEFNDAGFAIKER